LHEAQQTQELLARQTALGIETYYESVTNVLNLLQPEDNERRAPSPQQRRPSPPPGQDQHAQRRQALESGPLARLVSNVSGSIWRSIEDKTSLMFVVDPAEHMEVVRVIGDTDKSLDAAAVAKLAAPWLEHVQKKSISPFMQIGEGGAHL